MPLFPPPPQADQLMASESRHGATIIETYDGRLVVIPNADLFTHSVIVRYRCLASKFSNQLSELRITGNLCGPQGESSKKQLCGSAWRNLTTKSGKLF